MGRNLYYDPGARAAGIYPASFSTRELLNKFKQVRLIRNVKENPEERTR
jgi:hypothetical protein